MDEGSHTQSYFLGPLTVTISHIRGMIDNDYFTEGMGHLPRKETTPEPHCDEAVIFEEFFTIGQRMLLHPALSDILLKFQVHLHQLKPNAIIQLSKYIWEVTSIGVFHLLMASPRDMSCIISQEKWGSLLLPSRTSGPEPGLGHGSTARFPCFRA
jgi:hypothetical protein